MGLDNGINFVVSCLSKGIYRVYEVCYWRKYWTLRNVIVDGILPLSLNGGECLIQRDELQEIQNLLISLTTLKEDIEYENVSTIWSKEEEIFHLRRQKEYLQSALDFLDGNFSLKEFIAFLYCYRPDYLREKDEETTPVFHKLIEDYECGNIPEDFEYYFTFYDSY